MEKKRFGNQGEQLAVQFLQNRHIKILKQNFRTRFGEIDIIAKDKETICFVEVKTRSNQEYGEGVEAISKSKKKKIAHVAIHYLSQNNLEESPVRFDVISIELKGHTHKINFFQDAFEVEETFL
jgi:putative endonuclease